MVTQNSLHSSQEYFTSCGTTEDLNFTWKYSIHKIMQNFDKDGKHLITPPG